MKRQRSYFLWLAWSEGQKTGVRQKPLHCLARLKLDLRTIWLSPAHVNLEWLELAKAVNKASKSGVITPPFTTLATKHVADHVLQIPAATDGAAKLRCSGWVEAYNKASITSLSWWTQTILIFEIFTQVGWSALDVHERRGCLDWAEESNYEGSETMLGA